MRASVQRVLGGSILFGLLTACGGSAHSGPPTSSAGSDGITAGAAGNAGSSNAGVDSGGATSAGTGGADSTAGIGGAETAALAGASGSDGLGGSGGSSGATGSGGSAGLAYPPVDIGPQKKSGALDVLFVVDDSASMADKQNILSSSLPSFVMRLVNPLCLDAQGNPTAQQPASGALACSSGKRQLTPVTDMHLGVISTSIGGHGGTVCATAAQAGDHLDDRAELLPSQRDNVASYQGAGYLSFDTSGLAGASNVGSVVSDLQAMVSAAGERGCGFEAPLEAMYRFLVDPEPPVSVDQVNGVSTRTGLNAALLAQRNAFLRPDSALAIVILSDESDCSIVDDGVGWFVGSSSQMPLSTVACDTNANDPCCRSCAQRENAPPTGCTALTADDKCKTIPAGQTFATTDALHDSVNLRCYNQRQRFGFDLLYPIERYSDALSNPKIRNSAQQLVDNPLLAARDGKGPRSATLISVSVIVGAPWQDLASTASLGAGHALEYLDGTGLQSNQRWPLLVGDRANNVAPSDPFMNESVAARSGQNPLTSIPIVAPTSQNPIANAINGHEQNIPDFADLQYACTFALPTPKVCAAGDSSCDCSPDKSHSLAAVIASNSPLCQPPAGGAASGTQYYGKGYPGARELGFAQLLGARAVPASICPKTLSDVNSADYAYKPAFSALVGRIASTLK